MKGEQMEGEQMEGEPLIPMKVNESLQSGKLSNFSGTHDLYLEVAFIINECIASKKEKYLSNTSTDIECKNFKNNVAIPFIANALLTVLPQLCGGRYDCLSKPQTDRDKMHILGDSLHYELLIIGIVGNMIFTKVINLLGLIKMIQF